MGGREGKSRRGERRKGSNESKRQMMGRNRTKEVKRGVINEGGWIDRVEEGGNGGRSRIIKEG